MKTINDIEHLKGVKVLVRADFNVPIKNESVGDDFRIRAALPTINYLKEKGATVILISHWESIDGINQSLGPIVQQLNKLGQPVIFIKDYKKAHTIIEASELGTVFLLENLRFSEGEKNNDKDFSKALASLADIYINEAFPVSHREHASIVGIPKLLPSYIGLQFEKEINNLSKAFKPNKPFLFILGGAKFDTKLPLIERFAQIADSIFIGGALANDALLARGFNVGDSMVSTGKIDLMNIIKLPNIILPIDVVVQDHSQKNIENITENDRILDAGKKTLEIIQEKINTANFILWNGPLGPYEDGFTQGTEAVAKMIAEATKNSGGKVESIVGGGDTVAAISKIGVEDQITFISSGGGAMLDFLAKGTLPGIDALK